jgi:hypothetical protein
MKVEGEFDSLQEAKVLNVLNSKSARVSILRDVHGRKT